HSFGGGPALELALAHPERVQRLILVDAALGWDAEPKPHSPVCRVLATSMPRRVLLSATATNPLWSKTLLRSFVAHKEAVTNERLAYYRQPSELRGATDALGAWSHHFICEDERGVSTDPARISRLQVPMTLLWGADDTITPLDQAHRLRKLVPQSRLQVIPGVGHIPHIEAPEAFERTLLNALQVTDSSV
ncbi:MAG TPA: alpha/beta hydrolase, partial [Lysobacter sp.]|nr:alpha/beta hydrolase [Lysobacter sp.]